MNHMNHFFLIICFHLIDKKPKIYTLQPHYNMVVYNRNSPTAYLSCVQNPHHNTILL